MLSQVLLPPECFKVFFMELESELHKDLVCPEALWALA